MNDGTRLEGVGQQGLGECGSRLRTVCIDLWGDNKIRLLRCEMEQYIIKGGNPLVGEVEIGGAKNAALGILAAAIWQMSRY